MLCQALRTLGLACFICSEDDSDTARLLDMAEGIVVQFRGAGRGTGGKAAASEVHEWVSAAVDCWALLATTLPRSRVGDDHFAR